MEKKQTHTPGQISHGESRAFLDSAIAAFGGCGGPFYNVGGKGIAYSGKTAALWNAAPDLLRIAKWAVTMLQAGGKPDKCYFDEANAAIAKAEGR